MPKYADFNKDRLVESGKAVLAQKKPNIAKIAREFGISRTTLSARVEKAQLPATPTKFAEKHPQILPGESTG